jgi:hypothetical protein
MLSLVPIIYILSAPYSKPGLQESNKIKSAKIRQRLISSPSNEINILIKPF